MIAAHRFEIAPPPPAIDVAGQDLTSGSTNWTARPDLGETSFSAADSRRELDYMHARFRSPLTSRFLSTDPILGHQKRPQSWNRYAYVAGNPMRFVDPSGAVAVLSGTPDEQKKSLIDLRNTVPAGLRSAVKTTTQNGKLVLDARPLNSRKGAASGNFQALRQVANSPGAAIINSSKTSVGSEALGANAYSGGITLSSQQSASGSVEVYVGGDMTARETAETMAHEIRHARRYLLGLPSMDEFNWSFSQDESGGTATRAPNPSGPVNMETRSAEQEAARNYDPFVSPLD